MSPLRPSPAVSPPSSEKSRLRFGAGLSLTAFSPHRFLVSRPVPCAVSPSAPRRGDRFSPLFRAYARAFPKTSDVRRVLPGACRTGKRRFPLASPEENCRRMIASEGFPTYHGRQDMTKNPCRVGLRRCILLLPRSGPTRPGIIPVAHDRRAAPAPPRLPAFLRRISTSSGASPLIASARLPRRPHTEDPS